ncbi:MAG: hypothetical protein FJ147_07360 [Deltaproteobacteria bacterium]|nr:hypothetical protein [Deltaproteobacteria bacterium]
MPPMTTAVQALQRPVQRDPLAVFLFVSLLVHAVLLLFFPTLYRLMPEPQQEKLTEVELLPPTPPPPPPVVAKAEPPQVAPPLPQEKAQPVEKPKPKEQDKPKPPEAKPQERLPEQMVSPPDQVNDQIPEKTRLWSDRNSATKEETVAKGMPRPAPARKDQPPVKERTVREPPKPPVQQAKKEPGVESPTKKSRQDLDDELTPPKRRTPGTREVTKREPLQLAMKPPAAAAPKPELRKEHEQQIDEESLAKAKPASANTAGAAKPAPKLFARPEELLSQGWLSETGKDREEKEERKPPTGQDLIAMAPPPAENLLALPGPIGTPDLLPDIRQGNLTFLNAKANRFAPFVRRVALRVFQHLIIFQRKNLQLNDVVAARDYSTIEAKIDTQGNLKKLIIQTRSGSYAVDEALLRACENGAWDENPPAEAVAEDGMIHFIFRSDLNAQFDDLGLRSVLTTLQIGLI